MFSDPDILTYFPEVTDVGHVRVTTLGLLHSPAAPAFGASGVRAPATRDISI